jgi:hypothetical protein
VEIQQRILKFVMCSNWALFLGTGIAGYLLMPLDFAKGIVCGGLITTLNFHLLYRTLRKSLGPPHIASRAVVVAKSYIRFIISGIIIFFLVSEGVVHPLGLFVGLSVVVVSIMAATVCELKKIIFKEAV